MIKQVKKLILGIICYPLFIISKVIPKSENMWIFGAWYGNRYSDNTAYIFEYVNKEKSNVKAIWLSSKWEIISDLRSKGFKAYHKNSILGFYYGCRAAATFVNCGYSDVNMYAIEKSLKVQLWHGIPLKKIKNDDKINENIQRHPIINFVKNVFLILFPFLNEKYNLIISSGSEVSDRFESAFRVKRSKIIETGYPRMDIILSEKFSYNKTKLLDNYDNSIEKIILYAPTHREEGKGNSNLLNNSELEKINKFLQEQKSIMLIKMHYYELTKISPGSGLEFSNIQFLIESETNDINRILHHVDVLITDYSSVFYDFLVLDRPVLFAPFDLEEYQKIDRELYEDYSSATPGPICKNWDEIQIQLEEYFSNGDTYQDERKQIYNQYFQYSDNKNSARIIKTVKDYLSISN